MEIFDENFCLKNRFYDKAIEQRKTNPLYAKVTELQEEFIEKIVIERNLQKQNILELESYAQLLARQKSKFDIVKSNFFLHKLNDIEARLGSVKNNLTANGLFYGTFFGEENLVDFSKQTLALQDILLGQIYPMSLPVINTKTLGMLLHKIGFSDVSVLNIKQTYTFENVKQMLNFMRQIGGTNCLAERQKSILPKQFLQQLQKQYSNNFELTFDVNLFFCFG